MRALMLLTLLSCLPAALLLDRSAYAGGTGVSVVSDSHPTTFIDNIPFYQYKVPSTRSRIANRDLEFLWSATYNNAPFVKSLIDRDSTRDNDLDRLGLRVDSPDGAIQIRRFRALSLSFRGGGGRRRRARAEAHRQNRER